MKHCIFLLGLILSISQSKAQFETTYVPIQFSGEIPEHFRISAREKSLAEIEARDQAKLSEEQGKEYYTLSNFALSQVFLSGNIYFNDELTEYVNRVVDHLLQDDPVLRSQLNVHVSRFSTPNATSWRDGTILVNIGLLTFLQNEAQLAYILAHEIAHFQSEHTLLSFQKEQDLEKNYFMRIKG